MNILFIGDIVGRPGREMLKEHLGRIRDEHNIDFVIANYENASHGFGLTSKNAKELFSYGVDAMTGGNHTWDKKELIPLLEEEAILRPYNYPEGVPGKGMMVFDVGGEKLAVLNLMGYHAMPMCENPFIKAKEVVAQLHNEGIKNIFIDFHAEATAEKRGMMLLLQGEVSAIVGTHTHVSTDDLHIAANTAYITDIGLTGCRDNVIGMEAKAPLKQFMTGIKTHFDIPKKCKKILQCVIVQIEDGEAITAKKLKVFDNANTITTQAWIEE
jgi:metallophosphoesterase (TIGR00282 family)